MNYLNDREELKPDFMWTERLLDQRDKRRRAIQHHKIFAYRVGCDRIAHCRGAGRRLPRLARDPSGYATCSFGAARLESRYRPACAPTGPEPCRLILDAIEPGRPDRHHHFDRRAPASGYRDPNLRVAGLGRREPDGVDNRASCRPRAAQWTRECASPASQVAWPCESTLRNHVGRPVRVAERTARL